MSVISTRSVKKTEKPRTKAELIHFWNFDDYSIRPIRRKRASSAQEKPTYPSEENDVKPGKGKGRPANYEMLWDLADWNEYKKQLQKLLLENQDYESPQTIVIQYGKSYKDWNPFDKAILHLIILNNKGSQPKITQNEVINHAMKFIFKSKAEITKFIKSKDICIKVDLVQAQAFATKMAKEKEERSKVTPSQIQLQQPLFFQPLPDPKGQRKSLQPLPDPKGQRKSLQPLPDPKGQRKSLQPLPDPKGQRKSLQPLPDPKGQRKSLQPANYHEEKPQSYPKKEECQQMAQYQDVSLEEEGYYTRNSRMYIQREEMRRRYDKIKQMKYELSAQFQIQREQMAQIQKIMIKIEQLERKAQQEYEDIQFDERFHDGVQYYDEIRLSVDKVAQDIKKLKITQ